MTTPLDILAQQEARDVKWKFLANHAAKGPWEVRGDENVQDANGRLVIADGRDHEGNMYFIAESRTAIPALLADLARARAAIKRAIEQRDAAHDTCASLDSDYMATDPRSSWNNYLLDDNAALLAILRGET